MDYNVAIDTSDHFLSLCQPDLRIRCQALCTLCKMSPPRWLTTAHRAGAVPPPPHLRDVILCRIVVARLSGIKHSLRLHVCGHQKQLRDWRAMCVRQGARAPSGCRPGRRPYTCPEAPQHPRAYALGSANAAIIGAAVAAAALGWLMVAVQAWGGVGGGHCGPGLKQSPTLHAQVGAGGCATAAHCILPHPQVGRGRVG